MLILISIYPVVKQNLFHVVTMPRIVYESLYAYRQGSDAPLTKFKLFIGCSDMVSISLPSFVVTALPQEMNEETSPM